MARKRHYHISKHDKAVDRRNLEHARSAKHHESKHEAHEHEHRGMEHYERGAVKHHGHKKDPRHITAHDRSVDRHNLEHAHGRHHMGPHGTHTMNEHYAGMEPRRRHEMEDSGMIHEDHRAIANLPQEVMIKPYPMAYPNMPEDLDDTLRGIDMQMDYDDNKRRHGFYPKKV